MIEIKRVDARPEATLDLQRTVFWLDPRDNTCGVYVKRASEGTPVGEYHNVIVTHIMPFHLHEAAWHEWIAVNEPELTKVCEGHEVYWDGSNHRGRMNEEAKDTWDMLVADLNEREGQSGNYEVWDVQDWMQFVDVKAATTDEELAELVDIHSPMESDSDIVVGDILEHLQAVRAARRDEGGWDD